jgi:hypothetical protein
MDLEDNIYAPNAQKTVNFEVDGFLRKIGLYGVRKTEIRGQGSGAPVDGLGGVTAEWDMSFS